VCSAAAHPHVFIDSKVAVKFEAGVLRGIAFTWTFDNLENSHYFLAFQEGRKKLPRFPIEDFSASVTADGRLVYAFFVPLKLAVGTDEQSVAVTVYDDTYYVAFTLMKLDDVDVETDAPVATALAIQKALNDSLATLTGSLKGSRSLGGLLFVVLVSLAYGMFHAAGPGHGKTIISSFFLAQEARLRHSAVVGYLIAAVHALSALAVVLIIYYLIRGVFSVGVDQANHWIQLVTFAAITVIGGVLLVGRIRGKGHYHLHAHNERHDVSFRSLLAIALPAGAIPCPGAVAVVLFALSLNMVGVSVLSVACISVGMGTTITATGAAVILAKKGALKVLGADHGEIDSPWRRVFEIGGAAILLLFGLVFLLAQL
jgi:ABC-type nickel/cobalt efflux system permease component RcnA